MTLDAREYRIAVARARAQLALVGNQIKLAESQLEQSESLARDKFVSPDALRIKRTELAVRRSEYDAARQALAAAERDSYNFVECMLYEVITTASTTCSRVCSSAGISAPRRSQAASSRCLRSAAR